MNTYIDEFVLPVPSHHLNEYKNVSEKVAEVWKEYGALAYFEYVIDDMALDGTRSFNDLVEMKENEVVIFGWVVFPSKKIRNSANQRVPQDPRMADLVAPLTDPSRMIFDASRMVYGGFVPLVYSD